MTIRYIEFIRVSSEGQVAAGTPENQRRALDKLARRRPGHRLARIDPGHAVSGAASNDSRVDIQLLKAELAKHGKVDELRVYAFDRLTRADSHAARGEILDMAVRAGATIVVASGEEIDPSTYGGDMLASFYSATAADERRRIRSRTTAGRHRVAQAGLYPPGGRLPFGFRIEGEKSERRVVLDQESAKTVKQIFDWCVDSHLSCYQIAQRLTKQGSRTPTEGRKRSLRKSESAAWNHGSVRGILRTRTVTGEITRHVRDLDTGKLVEYAIKAPSIVSVELWELAQKRLDGNARRGGQRKVEALLRQRVKCGVCGSPMHVRAATHENGTAKYLCATRRSGKGTRPDCGAPPVAVEELDTAVFQLAVDALAHPFVSGPDNNDPAATWREQQRLADARLLELRAKQRRLLQFEDDAPDVVREELRSLQREIESCKEAARQAHNAISELDRRAGLIDDDGLRRLRERIERASFEDRVAIMDILIPPRESAYGVRVGQDGDVDVVGTLPLAASSAGHIRADSPTNSSRSSDR